MSSWREKKGPRTRFGPAKLLAEMRLTRRQWNGESTDGRNLTGDLRPRRRGKGKCSEIKIAFYRWGRRGKCREKKGEGKSERRKRGKAKRKEEEKEEREANKAEQPKKKSENEEKEEKKKAAPSKTEKKRKEKRLNLKASADSRTPREARVGFE